MNHLARVSAVVLALAALAGCATVYKSTAGDYVDSAKQITGAMQTAAAALSSAEQSRKGHLIAQDKDCPIGLDRIVLRPKAIEAGDIPPDYFGALAAKAGLGELPQCRRLLDPADKSVCFSPDEAFCIDQLGHFYSTAAAKAGAGLELKTTARQLADNLARLTYGAPLPDNFIAAASIRIVSAYLDVLGKAADGQAEDVRKQAKSLSDSITSAAEQYKKSTGGDLLNTSALATGQTDLTAFGAFAQDIAQIAQTARDTATIRAAVKKTAPDAVQAMETLRIMIISDAQLAGTLANNDTIRQRQVLQRRFHASSSAAAREDIVRELRALPTDGTSRLVESSTAIFDKARASHDTLVRLINNPSQKQLEQIRAQDFASFRNTAEDLAGLFILLAK
jgi:hypothetical protein